MISNADLTKHYEKNHQIKCEKVFTSEKEQKFQLKSDHTIKVARKHIHLSGMQHNKVEKQAGAELCQAQFKLG